MPHITSIERLGRQEGRQEEAINLILRQARKRLAGFGPDDEAAVRQLPLGSLEALREALLDFATIADLRHWLEPVHSHGWLPPLGMAAFD
ncbi:MAG: DUF4351 domain-containing protein [Verrucomicrobia bacterium]|nr:DUF4351 domain-containing protein [Verrucomicrobiota bacterium]